MSITLTQRQALLVLNGLPQIGPILLRRLSDAFSGDSVKILSAKPAEFLKIKGLGQKAADVIAHWPDYFDLAKEGGLPRGPLRERRARHRVR